MYFKSRKQAGSILAKQLDEFATHNTSVVALSPGGVIVGAQIAMHLHSNMMILLSENIYLPGEHEAIAALSSAGTFTYNNMFSPGQLEEFASEFNQYIEGQRIEKMHKLNMISSDGMVKKDYLRRHIVILVSDGMPSGFSLDVATQYLKTVALKKLIIATPFASVAAVDRMHLQCDEIRCLNVPANYMGTDHYYEDNTIPPTEELFKVLRNISLIWHRHQKK